MTGRHRSPRGAKPPRRKPERRAPGAGPERRLRAGVDWQVYALSAGPLPPTIRVGRHVARVLVVGPIAVIGATPAGESTFSEDALREQHEIVLSLAERIDPLLPARFDTRMTTDRLQATILGSVNVLTRALEKVRGRQQMTLRLIGAPIVEQPKIAGRSGAAYLAERRAAAHAIPSELEPLRVAVTPFVVEERVWPGRAGVRATLFHLVERDAVGRYRKAVERAATTMPAGSVTVSGPWPPFAFAPELPG